jgi:methyl-accepting chemotaxis protein
VYQEIENISENALSPKQNAINDGELIALLEAITNGDYTVEADTSTAVGKTLQVLIDKLKSKAKSELDRSVTLSISNNEASISSAQLLYALKNVENYSQRIAAAAEQMKGSVQEVKRYSDSIDEGATSSLSVAQQVSANLGKAVDAFDNIKNSVCENSEKLSTLSKFTIQIKEIAEQIKAIAFQSNLLSMNASVEAARAGTHGAGFGVIAQEIHMLSGRSEDAIAKIATLVRGFETEVKDIKTSMGNSESIVNEGQESISAVNEKMDNMVTQFEKVSANTSQISQALAEQTSASAEVAKGINTIAMHSSKSVRSTDDIVEAINQIQVHVDKEISLLADLNIPGKIIKLAQSDHVIWKKRLVSMIAGKEGLLSNELADHHSCRLGKWYDNVAVPELRQHRAFIKLQQPHKLVHYHGKKAVDLYNSGNIGAALNEIKVVEKESSEVLLLLRALENV